MRELIAPTTASVTKRLHINTDRFASVAASGLTGVEKITFRISLGGVYTDILPEIVIDVVENYIQVAGPNTYEIVKPTTASPVGVYVEN